MLEMDQKPAKSTPRINLKISNRIVVAGIPGSGKSTFARYLASHCLPPQGQTEPNLMIIDPLNQYGVFDELIGDGYRFVPERQDIQDLERICRHLCGVSNHMLLIEECEDYIYQGVSLPPYTYKVIRQGRNWGIGLMGVSQRIQEVDKKFVDRANHLFLFKCGFESFSYLREKIGKERAVRVLALDGPTHEFVHYDISAQTFYKYKLNLKGGGRGKLESAEPGSTKNESHDWTRQEASDPRPESPAARPENPPTEPRGLEQSQPQAETEPRIVAGRFRIQP